MLYKEAIMSEDAKINPGTPVINAEGKLTFDGASHPKLAEVRKAVHTQKKEFANSIKGDLASKWEEYLKENNIPAEGAAEAASKMEHRLAFQKKHAPEAYKAAQEAHSAHQAVSRELLDAQKAALKDVKVIGEASEEATKAAIKEFGSTRNTALLEADRIVKPTMLKNNFAAAREEGWVAAVKKNFSKEAFKEAPVKQAVKGGTALVGVGAVLDAVGRSQTTGPDGQPIERSKIARLVEAAGGAALAGGALLHGGR